MGMTNLDPVLDGRTGQNISNTYINIGSISLFKNGDEITVSFPIITYYSKGARLANLTEFSASHVHMIVNVAIIETPLYTLMYNHIKTIFTNTVDDI